MKNVVLKYLQQNPSQSSKEIFDGLTSDVSYATVKRVISGLLKEELLLTDGKLRGAKYRVSLGYELSGEIDVNEYFSEEQDNRQIKDSFNFSLITDVLTGARLFTTIETNHLKDLQAQFKKNVAALTVNAFKKEMERLAIDLSWKSSQIEGNTYSLLETERLLNEHKTADGKPRDDATMLLNHKTAINFITANPDYVVPLSVRSIEDIHSLLIKDLNVDRNIRRRRVGVTGTNYKPLDNEHQIREALEDMCRFVNSKGDVFEKSFYTLVLLSYIQAFDDGNKRTARIVSNAILIANNYCPLSFRTVDSIEYKKAMLIFYEQNNISAFKRIFIDQFEFAVNTYF